ncbi:hypothetical protein [uncultured Desulfosarcina sp.]|uniref:tyrosine-type recombinase/integrase n=1 Tax=uncultured Desulfosarcina sp. TaxID=218289 RepID=UPI0029C634E5|nr:hypothetical protein [uncultured Desulfosarcina sp.]
MKGGIYSTTYGWQLRFGKVTRRFKKHEYEKAEYLLAGLRFKAYEGTFDIRDYRRDEPLGFSNLVETYISSKRHLKAIDKYRQRLRFGIDEWANRNVKGIGYADLQNLFNALQDRGLSSYYIKHIRDCMRSFWRWLVDTGQIEITQMPKMPVVKAHAAYRKILSKEDQHKVLDEIYRISWDFNPRIYIGCLFLTTYINIRPSELRHIKEKHIDLATKTILVPDPKEGEPKFVHLLEQDADLIRSIPRSFPEMYFFRHIKGYGSAKPGGKFGPYYFQRWWNRACRNLKIVGVSLYPGTRHSSAVALRQRHSPEAVKRASGTRTNKAFERYLQLSGDEVRALYADTRTDNKLITFPVSHGGE